MDLTAENIINILDAAYNGIVIIDKEGKIIVYNKAAGKMLNKDPKGLLGKFIGDVFPQAWEELKEVIEKGRPQIGKKTKISDRTIIVNRTPIYNNNNSIEGVISIFQDISEYEKILVELEVYKRINRELDAIINSSFDGLWICDDQGRVVKINRASEKINDVKAEQVVGKKMEEIVQEGLVDRSVSLEVLKKKTSVTLIQQLKNGKQILVTGSPITDDHDKIQLVVVNERDITELNRLRKELEETKALTDRYRIEITQLQDHQDLSSEIISRSGSMRRILSTALRVAQVDSTVLIQGESGVGKGMIAKLIHRASKHKEGPFVRVDCGAIPESLIESELFGYEEGAFTGARIKGKPGQLEMAKGGTLFLDEIGELPLNMQVKLLRFLEENEIVRVGGIAPIKIHTRVISATHRDLQEMVKKGKFRKDLFFRLNVIPIKIPPLRERPEDIPPLIHFFLDKFNKKCSTSKVLTPRAMDCLCSYPFPGNVRELANLVERLVVLSPDNKIDIDDLPANIRLPVCQDVSINTEINWNLPIAVRSLERDLIIRALKTFKTQRRAAVHLGIDQSTLARKIKRYGIGRIAISHYDA